MRSWLLKPGIDMMMWSTGVLFHTDGRSMPMNTFPGPPASTGRRSPSGIKRSSSTKLHHGHH